MSIHLVWLIVDVYPLSVAENHQASLVELKLENFILQG